VYRPRAGFGRGEVDGDGGDRRGRSRRCALGLALCTIQVAANPPPRRKPALGDAQQVRRTRRGQDTSRHRRPTMTTGGQAATEAVQAHSAESHAPAPPCTMVIFGGAGDLTKRKLVPALYNLAASGLLGEAFAVVAIARGEMTHE